MGPIDYIVVEFPGSKMTGEGFPLLVDLVDRGIIRIIDLAFVTKDLDGTVRAIAIADFDGDGAARPRGVRGRVLRLDRRRRHRRGRHRPRARQLGGLLVYENVWAGPFAGALRRGGGQLAASGRIPVQALLAALDAAESADPV